MLNHSLSRYEKQRRGPLAEDLTNLMPMHLDLVLLRLHHPCSPSRSTVIRSPSTTSRSASMAAQGSLIVRRSAVHLRACRDAGIDREFGVAEDD